MKNLIIATLLTTTLALGSINNTSNYPTCGTIISVNYETDVAVFEDHNEFRWGFKGVEDYLVGDIVAVIMNDQGTETIFDDQIVKIRYCGYED